MKIKSCLSKSVILGMLLFSFIHTINAQQSVQSTRHTSAFLGVGLGINDNGFGMCLEVPMIPGVSIYGNAGLGGWGWKLGVGGTYYPSKTNFNSSFSLGYAYASGLKDFETTLAVEPNDLKQNVNLDLNKIHTLNLVYAYNFHMGKRSKFVLSTGYAIKLSSNAYEIYDKNIELNNTSKQVLEILQPGGVIIGFKFLFGLD